MRPVNAGWGLENYARSGHIRHPMKTFLLAALAATTLTALTAHADTTATAAFASLKKLQGDWRGPAMAQGLPPSHSVFRVTSAGSAVQETIFPGTKMEMLSVYYLDKGNLLMTHYCALGNQPRMKLNTRQSTARELVFDFAGGTNLSPSRDRHMHSLRLTLPASSGPRKLTATGTSWEGGREKSSCAQTLKRTN